MTALLPLREAGAQAPCRAGQKGLYVTWDKSTDSTGTGTFISKTGRVSVLSNFTWTVTGSPLSVRIGTDEPFQGGNSMKGFYGQADNANNLNVRIEANNAAKGQPIPHSVTVTLTFDRDTPGSGWAFALVDIDVDQIRFNAKDARGREVPTVTLSSWFEQRFDANPSEDGVNIPSWDAANAALVGSSSASTKWRSTVEGHLDDTEAASAWFSPSVPLSELSFTYESLQEEATPSFHILLAACAGRDGVGPNPTPTPTAISTPGPLADTDGDTIPDSIEGEGDPDGDGVPNKRDLDSDGDTIPDESEGSGDSDGDGTPDFMDPDSDNDTIPDAVEGGDDNDKDDVPNSVDRDSDNDTVPDRTEGSDDTDGDGSPDSQDGDSDGDDVPDIIERNSDTPVPTPSGLDDNGNGVDDSQEGTTDDPLPDSDSDGTPDLRDTDSDNDGAPDGDEAFDLDGDGNPDVEPSGEDIDGDGVDDAFEDFGSPDDINPDFSGGPSDPPCGALALRERKSAVLARLSALYARVPQFAARASACGGAVPQGLVASAAAARSQFEGSLSRNFKDKELACPETVCRSVQRRSAQSALQSIAQGLYGYAKSAKLSAGRACALPPSGKPDKRPQTEEYLRELRSAIDRLPREFSRCE